MKNISVIIILFLSVFAFGQDSKNINRSVPVSFEDFTRDPFCVKLGGWCSSEIQVVSQIEPRDPNLYYGRFYIDSNDSLKLGLEKGRMPISTILFLFENNLFTVDSILNIPPEVAGKLGLYGYQSKIQAGEYRIYDSENMKEIIINFGKVSINNVDNDSNSSGQLEKISPIKKETDEHD